MADYLVLKQTANRWDVVNAISGKTATDEGAGEAIVQSFTGAGRYTAVRIDNARIVDVTVEPKLTPVVEEPAEELVEDPAPEPIEPVAEDPAVSDGS